MNLVGYGILKNDRPIGLWPAPFEYCSKSLERYIKHEPPCELRIVKVYAGETVHIHRSTNQVPTPKDVA